jgi:hypothetical protein
MMIPAMLPKTRRGVAGGVLTGVVLMLFPATARADAGIPMLPVTYQTMLFFLLLVIIIEMIYLQARLKPPILRTLIAVTTVNAATTGLGFPLTWAIYAALDTWANFPGGMSDVFKDNQFVPLWVSTKILPDIAGTPAQVWATIAVFVVLLIPSYLVTRILKTWVFEWYDLLRYEGDIRPAILIANRFSYLLLAITGCLLLYRTFHGM